LPVKVDRNIYLEIDGSAIDLPITEAGGVGTAPAADFRWHFGWLLVAAALFGFGQSAPGSWRQQFAWQFGAFRCRGLRVVVVGFLHHALLPENIENSLRITKS
jgi:hypothetical protein